MNVGQICRRGVVTTYRGVVLSEAARQMREHHVGSIVVVEETDLGPIPAGMLTDRDIVVAVVAKDLDARTIAVGEVMSTEPATIDEQASVTDALREMRRRGVRRVPVVDANGALVGIISTDDLLEVIAEEIGGLREAIQSEQSRERRVRE